MPSGLDRLTALVQPPSSPPGAPDWKSAEEALGFGLPSDYRQLVEVYGAGSFDEFISLLVPGHENPHLDLLRQRDVRLDALRTLREGGETIPFDVDAGQEDIVPWAITDNGDVVYWIREPRDAPDDWRVVVNEARGPAWEAFAGSATEFLAAVLSETTRIAIFPEDFPSDSPRFDSMAG